MRIGVFLLFFMLPFACRSNGYSTECPSGYIAINLPYVSIAMQCPSGTVALGEEYLGVDDVPCEYIGRNGICMMYMPAGNSYTDSVGTYEYTEPCAL